MFSPVAIDYSKGVRIYDPVMDRYYTQEQAEAAPKRVQERLLLKGNKIGAWVLTIDEIKEMG